MNLLKKNWLLGVFALPLSTDVLFTVMGQPREYWSTGYKVVNEAAPVQFLLHINPLLFIAAGFLIWLPIAYLLTKKLPKPLDLWAGIALFAGHTYNSVAWLRHNQIEWHFLSGSLIPMTIYILVVAYLASVFLMRYFGEV